MPSGIILSSGSEGATQADIEKVLEKHGYEAEKTAAQETEELVEPKREDFKSDEDFEKAQEEFEAAAEEAADEAEKAAEKKEEERQARQEERHRPSRRQRAVEKATADLKKQLEEANSRLKALEAGKKPGEEVKVQAPKAPKREDFPQGADGDAKFDEAMFDYRYQLRRAKEQAEAQQNTLKARLEKNYTDYQDAVAAFKEEHDDWEKVVGQSIAIPEAVYYAIVDLAADGPRVTYYLGQHPEKLDALAEMTPYRAAIEVGRIADQLKGGRKPATEAGAERRRITRPKRNIPEPVRPLSTSATTSTLTSRDAAAKGDFKAFKQAQRRGA